MDNLYRVWIDNGNFGKDYYVNAKTPIEAMRTLHSNIKKINFWKDAHIEPNAIVTEVNKITKKDLPKKNRNCYIFTS